MDPQKPLELILARNLLASVATPAFLLGKHGELLFYNDAAAVLLGRRFEEHGIMSANDWTAMFGPFGDDGKPLNYEEIPATLAIRANRPYHGIFRIAGAQGEHHDIAASTIPIVGSGGPSGAIVIFWPIAESNELEAA